MRKSLTKIVGIVFLIVLAGLLVTHFIILRNVGAEFTAKETALNTQVSDLKQQVEDLAAENQILNVKLGIAGIKDDVLRNNFGTARDSVDAFHGMLVEGGCKKMDQLKPVFENLNASLLKKNNEAAVASLEQIHDIIFRDAPAAQ